jgi:uncharacterized protein YjbJ (UPF0337 family)
MNPMDKLKNKAWEASGRVKRYVGKAIGNENLEEAGHSAEIKADLKQAVQNANDALVDE